MRILTEDPTGIAAVASVRAALLVALPLLAMLFQPMPPAADGRPI